MSARITLAIAVLLALAAGPLALPAIGATSGGSAAPMDLAPGHCGGAYQPPRAGATRKARKAMLCLINRLRRAHGVRPLRPHPRLTQAAQAYSEQMVARRFFGHADRRGNTVSDRLRAQGYLGPGVSWTVGENLAWATGGMAAPTAVLRGWHDSPGHRALMLRPGFEDAGLGVAPLAPTGGAGATYTLVLGARG